MKILAGDVGGTKILLAILTVEESELKLIEEERLDTGSYDELLSAVRSFSSKHLDEIEGACFAVAGPVVGDQLAGPNLDWSVDANSFIEEISIPRTVIINDLTAVAYGIDLLTEDDVEILQNGEGDPEGPIALIGAGTGLGEAFLTWDGEGYSAHASEGGNSDFAPRTTRESDLLSHLRKQHDHVSYERVVSGPGLVSIYRYLTDTGSATESPQIAKEMTQDDPAGVISRHALAHDDDACESALDLFVSAYGAEAGNLALKILATGGVYVAGGIAPQIIEKLQDGTFMSAFRDKGWHSDLLGEIPVAVILNPRISLLGAASVAIEAASS